MQTVGWPKNPSKSTADFLGKPGHSDGDQVGPELTIEDVTLQRPGVYYEGGFAMGLPRTVIWTCRKDELASVHFDTRQFNHVVWETPSELRERLTARIRRTDER
jgi:hypothetical protein